MIEYFVLVAPVFLLVMMQRGNALCYGLACVYLALFSGLRFNVGYDYPAYVDIYNYSVDIPLEYFSELLMHAARSLGNYQYYFLISSVITVACVGAALWRYSRDPSIALLGFLCMPYMFLASLSVVRQYTAIAIGFYVLSFHGRLAWWIVLSLIACATLLHVSAFVLIPLVLLWPVLQRSVPSWVLICLLLVVYSVSSLVRDLAYGVVPFALAHFGNGDNGGMIYLLYLLILFVLLAFQRKAKLDVDEVRFLNIFFIGVALFTLTISWGEAAARISYYFLIFVLPLLGSYVRCFRPQSVARIGVMICILSLLFLQLFVASRHPVKDQYSPYLLNADFLVRDLW